jgi:transposase
LCFVKKKLQEVSNLYNLFVTGVIMQINLSKAEKSKLEKSHKKERDKRCADRIKAVLLFSEGWTQVQISQALRIREDTVHDHLSCYLKEKRLQPSNGGSVCKLSVAQTKELTNHLERATYDKVSTICAYVQKTYGIKYSISGMTGWLHKNKFSYKKPKGTPLKACPAKQEEFIEKYLELTSNLPTDEVIEFGDGVHPTMATKITSGWIRKGKDKLIPTIASRTRMNLFGSINLESMSVTINQYDTINSETLKKHFVALKAKYAGKKAIHLVLDKGSYNISVATMEAAKKHGITLHHLPPYSPNLNPIERLWKVMNEYVRNNKFFASAKEFRTAIMDFFEKKWKIIKDNMRQRINDNFQVIAK